MGQRIDGRDAMVADGWLGDMIVTTIAPPFEERQQMLETLDPLVRLHLVINMLAREADVLELEDEIHSKAQSEVDRTQREFYLREQMKAIQTELGEGDVWTREVQELRTRLRQLHYRKRSWCARLRN